MSRYEEDNSLYNDGEDKKPKLVLWLGIIIIIVIILVLIISCGMNNAKSSNNYLSYLKINNEVITPEFNKNVMVYSVSTKEDMVAISCDSESSKATVSGCNKKVNLYDKSNTHTITVIAEDKSVRTYKISITKEEESLKIPVVDVTSTIENDNKDEITETVLTANVSPNSSTVVYQWYKNNEKIEGATSSSYKVTSTGEYFVEISDSNIEYPISSNTFKVNIKEKEKKEDAPSIPNSSKNKETSKKDNLSYVLKIVKVNGNSSKWVKSVTLSVEVSTSNGLASKAYSFDGGKTYQASNSKTFSKNQTVNIVVKDIKGNTANKKVTINKIDNTTPSVSISGSDKTSTSVVLTASVNPTSSGSGYKYQWYKNDTIITNATKKTYKVTSTGRYKVRVTTGVGKSAFSNIFSFTVVVKPSCPMLSVLTESGNAISDKTWTNEKVLIKIQPSNDTVSYDVYINESNNMNSISQKYSYYSTFNNAVRIKLSNKGMRMIKIISRDQYGNSSTCYSKAYYLK